MINGWTKPNGKHFSFMILANSCIGQTEFGINPWYFQDKYGLFLNKKHKGYFCILKITLIDTVFGALKGVNIFSMHTKFCILTGGICVPAVKINNNIKCLILDIFESCYL